MREPPLEGIGDEIVLAGAGKALDQEIVGRRQLRAPALEAEPFAHRRRQLALAGGVGQHLAHPGGEEGRERELAAVVGRHARLRAFRPGDDRHHLAQAFETQDLAREDEGVAGAELLDEPFLHFAQHAAAPEADLDHRRTYDGADVEAVLPGDPSVSGGETAGLVLGEAVVAFVAAKRIAPGSHEIQYRVEVGAGEPGIGCGAADLAIKLVGLERRGAGQAENMLCQHVESARAHRLAVQLAFRHRVRGGATLQHLEAVGRHQQRPGRRLQAVIGAPDPLREAAQPLGRADLDYQVDVAPVDAEVQRRGADHGAERTPDHRRLDLAPPLDRE